MILWLDLETYSSTPIANGVHKYSEDASIILFAYAIDNEPAKVWDVTTGEPIPEELDKALHDDSVIIYAHNSHFDRTITKKFYPCVSDPKRWRDTMILAYSYSLPGSLHDLCGLLQLPTDKAKDEDGRRLVLLFTKPRPATSTIRRATRETHPEDWERFVNYARLDVEAMREVYNRLPKWNDTPEMWAEWHLDQEINDRGMNIDTELVKAAVEAVKDAKDDADENIRALTNGDVQTVGQCDALLKHIANVHKISLPDTQKATLERRLNDPDVPQAVKDLIDLRLNAGMASVKKFEALERSTNQDGRLRGCLQFYGAGRTGRWCLTGDHEVLTPSGWIRLDQWEGGEILCYNPYSHNVDFIQAKALQFDYMGDLYHIHSKNCDQVSTPDHKMPVRMPNGSFIGWEVKGLCEDCTEGFNVYVCKLPLSTLPAIYESEKVHYRDYSIYNSIDAIKVYCAETETGFFTVRRNGKVWITGNSGKVFQPQNITRGSLKPAEVEEAIQALKNGSAPFVYDNINKIISSCIRGAICAPKGKKLVVADLSNIEGRVLAWLAGENWKLQAFRDFDAGHGTDLYKATYGRTFGIDPKDVTKQQRQIGKVLELAMGYSGGVGAFLNFANVMRVDLKELAQHTFKAIDSELLAQSQDAYTWFKAKGMTEGIDQDVFIACEAIKRAWRSAHPATVKLWADLDSAFLSVLRGERDCANVAHSTVFRKASYLCIRLPSGRSMCYPVARLPQPTEKASFCYWGQFQASKNWGYVRTYSGKCCIAKGTKVITKKGLISIENIKPQMEVWDGEKWVMCEGAIYKGNKEVIKAYGVYMTPDHKVLTDKGWKSASQSSMYNRLKSELPNGISMENLQMPEGSPIQSAEPYAEVYDLINCGPDHRFVAVGESGPVIVHNCENLTQAVARDVLASTMQAIEDAGYKIVLSVHDELITETPDTDDYNNLELSKFMATAPKWAEGLPLAAAGFDSYRYKKD